MAYTRTQRRSYGHETWESPISARPSGSPFLTDSGINELRQAGGEDYLKAICAGFAVSGAHGVIALTGNAPLTKVGAELRWWRSVGRAVFAQICSEGVEAGSRVLGPNIEVRLRALREGMPLLFGGEYVTDESLLRLGEEMVGGLEQMQRERGDASLLATIRTLYPDWSHVGKLVFHLAERAESDPPFAMLVTYELLDVKGRLTSIPLGRAYEGFQAENNKNALLTMLEPLKAASSVCPFLQELCDSGEIYHPLALQPTEVFSLLRASDKLAASGITIRYPKWRSGGPKRPQISVTLGDTRPATALIGYDNLVDFSLHVALGEEKLSKKDINALLKAGEGLVRIKGNWVAVSAAELTAELEMWQKLEQKVARDGLAFVDALKILSGAGSLSRVGLNLQDGETSPAVSPQAGKWLEGVLSALKGSFSSEDSITPVNGLEAQLRGYQERGVEWLWRLYALRMSGVLADDMGLGKTIQVIALLLLIRQRDPKAPPSLLIVPASLVGNWQNELARFAPTIRTFVAHPSEVDKASLAKLNSTTLRKNDLVVTTYAYLQRLEALKAFEWNCIILDEAQAIKNAGAKQTKEIKGLTSRVRFALTGTPVENRLGDLWSLFDFLAPGLLGTTKEFSAFVKRLSSADSGSYTPLRNLVRPYILRRMKTDKTIISDLPEKTELKVFCQLSKTQAGLYSTLIDSLKEAVEAATGVRRKGIILSFLQQFKQLCNHPSQWSGDGGYHLASSGKFDRLRDLCTELAERQEKVLVFTQFREMTKPLAAILEEVFGRPGLVLHGGTTLARRKQMVNEFAREDGPPFFVLSLKAGGTGLNLTQANHVIHFDRWWNPAVEDQATDRAFRIGQKRNVMVHKFVTRGTLEERIDEMIDEKRSLSHQVLADGAEAVLTEMSNEELLRLVSLDLRHAVA